MVGMSELYDSLQEIKEDKKINTKIYINFFIYILTCLFNEKCNEPEKKLILSMFLNFFLTQLVADFVVLNSCMTFYPVPGYIKRTVKCVKFFP